MAIPGSHVGRTADFKVVPVRVLVAGRRRTHGNARGHQKAVRAVKWTVERLRGFEARVKDAVQDGRVRGPSHLSGGNESQLIEIFRDVKHGDWCFATYRSHYHALLHGLPEDYVAHEILAGRSMSLHSPYHRFFTSAIVGGCLPIAVGVAAAIKRQIRPEHVWCFVGDMAASAGTFYDCNKYAARNDLPITFVIEDNGMSTYTPTQEVWGPHDPDRNPKSKYYCYTQTEPHIGAKTDATL